MNLNATWIIFASLAAAGAVASTAATKKPVATTAPAAKSPAVVADDHEVRAVAPPLLVPIDDNVIGAIWDSTGPATRDAVRPVVFQPDGAESADDTPAAADAGPRLVSISVTSPANLTWNIHANEQPVIRVPTRAIQLNFTGDVKTFRIRDDTTDRFVDEQWTDSVEPLTVDAGKSKTINLQATRRKFTVLLAETETPLAPRLTVIPPLDAGQPSIGKIFNNKFDERRDVSGPTPVNVLGDYLKLDINNAGELADLQVDVFRMVNGTAEFVGNVIPRPSRIPSDGKLTTELNLPAAIAARPRQGLLLPFVLAGDQHVFVEQPVHFKILTDRRPASSPSITSVAIASTAPNASEELKLVQNFREPRTWVVTDPRKTFMVVGTAANIPAAEYDDSRIALYQIRNGARALMSDPETKQKSFAINSADGTWRAIVTPDADGDYQFEAEIIQGDMHSPPSETVTVLVRTKGPSVREVEPQNRLLGEGRINVTVYFNRDRLLDADSATDESNYLIVGPGIDSVTAAPAASGGAAPETPTPMRGEGPIDVEFNADDNAVRLTFKDYPKEGVYTITVKESLEDIYGNSLGKNYPVKFNRSVFAELPSVRPGISGPQSPYVPFQEFTGPRTVPDGFNPHDKVETRVARLYYYRDAHRVAQIVNRKVRSYNRQGVDMQRQLADKARTEADQRTDARQQLERAAIIKAQQTRAAENELQARERELARSIQELSAHRGRDPQADPRADSSIQDYERLIDSLDRQIQSLRRNVQALREDEVAANEAAIHAEALEQRAREDQFRREVAAAHADPDTYAPGLPTSDDPVEQVSVSVIGEGLIHLRGPLKGINTIRTMIDQIDQPVGQVRVAVHTVQINGEKQARMEDVANIIQMYIDHSRFLTAQTSEMLRKSVVQVASRKAETARMLNPGDTQEDRDRRYLDSFFGKDFIDELEAMDSEFLRTGNKILSLHSMDTTSLSSALNLIALAKNSTRLEIFEQFDQMLQGELPMAEAAYIQAGMTACREKHSFRHPPKFYPMAQNAAFQSLRGFFDMQIGHDDTMTPLQREFIRLAQIFKGRLITELEYKQRVRERAIIEERLGNREQELREARIAENAAKKILRDADNDFEVAAKAVGTILTALITEIDAAVRHQLEHVEVQKQRLLAMHSGGGLNKRAPIDQLLVEDLRQWSHRDPAWIKQHISSSPWYFYDLGDEKNKIVVFYVCKRGDDYGIFTAPDSDHGPTSREIEDAQNESGQLNDPAAMHQAFVELYDAYTELHGVVERFDVDSPGYGAGLRKAAEYRVTLSQRRNRFVNGDALKYESPLSYGDFVMLRDYSMLLERLAAAISSELDAIRVSASDLVASLIRLEDARNVTSKWKMLRERFLLQVAAGSDELQRLQRVLPTIDQEFQKLLQSELSRSFAMGRAQAARRPLDHKKFLDMLIDDLEEKYIELLDGTRAHTANVDNYLKRVTTALDDDFNTQFYNPAFRYIRETGASWDVQFGQIETTSILANNRELGKVDPSATMEFDLPARGTVIAEALNGAKAMIDDVGALANDPTFLAMAKSQMGSPADPPPGSTRGSGVVRDVIPGLQTSTAEQVMAHTAGARPQLGSNLENLIPDPAIYKFETGTGYEIRPVIQPDGQAVVFDFHYMYTTNVREPVRPDEKHLGRVKRHFIDTDVQLSNFELREVSRYTVALKAARTSRGVPLLEDIPGLGVLFRPLPSQESSLQQNIILSQATIFPTLFDLMGLRWAPAAADLDPLRVTNREFVVRGRNRSLENRVYDYSSAQVDEFLRIPEAIRRSDLYRTQESLPAMHPNGYQGPGLDLRDSHLQEGYQPQRAYPEERFIPSESKEGSPLLPRRGRNLPEGAYIENYPLEEIAPGYPDPQPLLESPAGQAR